MRLQLLGKAQQYASHLPKLWQTVSNRNVGNADTGMRYLFRSCVAASCMSVVSVFVLSNTVLALTTRHYCIVLFSIPFTDRTFALPYWMWGWIPLSVCAASTLPAVILWATFLVKRTLMQRRYASNS